MDRDLKVDRSRDATGHCLRQGDRRKEAGRERAQTTYSVAKSVANPGQGEGIPGQEGGSTKRRTGKV